MALPKFYFGPQAPLTPQQSYHQLASQARILINYVIGRRTFNCDEIAAQASEINQALKELRLKHPHSFTAEYEAVVDLLHLLLGALKIRIDVLQQPSTAKFKEHLKLKQHSNITFAGSTNSMRRRNTRHEPTQVVFLRNWYEMRLAKDGNQPVYLRDPVDLDYLIQKTRLTETQIRDWVSNERRRRKILGRHHHHRYELPNEW